MQLRNPGIGWGAPNVRWWRGSGVRRMVLAAVAWVLLTQGAALPADRKSVAPPNVLLIIADDHGWTDYGFMGHPHVRTPRLDRLASESLTFTRGYVPASLCCPSLASILTGLPPHRHRIVCNDPPRPVGMERAAFPRSAAFREGRERLAQLLGEVPTLPRELGKAGYRSFQAGKWWQGHFARGGFTHGMTTGDPDAGGRHGDAGLGIGRQTLEPILRFWDDAAREQAPWFVWFAPMMPHEPHTPPQRLVDYYLGVTNSVAVARYWAMVEWFDATCGALLDELERRGLSTNTLVAYVADNGWITDPATGRFAPRSKQSPYDGGLRTPILLRWRGHFEPRRDDRHAVSSLDLMPTLLRAVGRSVPAGLPGIDLHDPSAVARRDAVFGACFTHDGQDLENPSSGLRWRWVVDGRWKLIMPAAWNEPAGKGELFDLRADPFETTNRAADEDRRVRRMLRRLDDWWRPTNPQAPH